MDIDKRHYNVDFTVSCRDGVDDIPLAMIVEVCDEIRVNGRRYVYYKKNHKHLKLFSLYCGSQFQTYENYVKGLKHEIEQLAYSDIIDISYLLVNDLSAFWLECFNRLEKEVPELFKDFKPEFDLFRKKVIEYDK